MGGEGCGAEGEGGGGVVRGVTGVRVGAVWYMMYLVHGV